LHNARGLDGSNPPAAAATKDQGRSRSGRKIHFQLEEAAEAEGTGTAAAAAAAAAMQAKEEGRRLDALTVNAIEGYRQLVKDQREWLQEIRRNERAAQRRVERYEQTHVALIDTVRESLLARVNSEIELVKTLAEREDQDPAAGILGAILEKNGFKLPGSKGPPNGSHGDK